MKKQLLFVDDDPNVLEGIRRLLRNQRKEWEMTFVDHANKALQESMVNEFDVIVTDISMSPADGFELLKTLRNIDRTKDIPVVILTGLEDKNLKQRALDLGATDILNKPVNREDLLARLRSCFRLKAYIDQIKNQNNILEQMVRERTQELQDTRLQIIQRLGRAAEYRDNETGMHVIRMSNYSALLGKKVGMSAKEVDLLLNASPMHDIGKIGIPDHVLLKPEKLDAEEWEIMKSHVAIGAEILSGDDSELLQTARTVALHHHEKWDGSGYPMGLKGEEISLEGRIVALCDVFDALTSERPYKKAWPVEEAVNYIKEQNGKHFDPQLVYYFADILPKILEIKQNFPDFESSKNNLDSVSIEDVCRI